MSTNITTLYLVLVLRNNKFRNNTIMERKNKIYLKGGTPKGPKSLPPPPNIISNEIKNISILFKFLIKTYTFIDTMNSTLYKYQFTSESE